MSVIEGLVQDVPLPMMWRARQIFGDDAVADLDAAMAAELDKPAILETLRPGTKIAVGIGSRGLAELPRLTRLLVDGLRARGVEPFIVPAMGSHGGATAEGQVALLGKLGVTEASAGCPIRSSMEVVELGRLDNGLAVYMDKVSAEADGIVFLNRVKPHTSFSATHESGLVKMLAIGLGKQRGADTTHALGFGVMGESILAMAKIKLAQTPVLFGVATVENGYDRIAQLEAVPSDQIIERDAALLQVAKALMPAIRFNDLDVLIVDEMGKEYSGTGMDPNITGRAATPYVEARLRVSKLAVLSLSPKSGGNACGVGLADVTTRRLVDRIDTEATYANHITSTTLQGARIPMTMRTDRLAIKTAAKTCNAPDPARLRIVRIPNTLAIGTILISEALVDEAAVDPAVEVVGEGAPLAFDDAGRIAPFPESLHAAAAE